MIKYKVEIRILINITEECSRQVSNRLMFIYFANILLVIVWALIFCRGNILHMDDRNKRSERTRLKRTIFMVLCFAQCFFIVAVRKRVGWDYWMYSQGFIDIYHAPFSDFGYLGWEKGYILLNKLVAAFTSHGHMLFAAAAFLSLIGPFYMIWKYSKNEFLSVFLYLNLSFLYMDMNYMRQSIALSIICFSYPFIRDKKFWRFLLIVIAAAFFHKSALYMIPVYFVLLLKADWKAFVLYMSGLAAGLITSKWVVNFILQKLNSDYLGSRFIENGISWYYGIFVLVFCCGFFLMIPFLKKKPRTVQISVHFALLTFVWQAIMLKHSLLERFSFYSLIFLLVALPECLYVFEKRYKKQCRVKAGDLTYENGKAGTVAAVKAERATMYICVGVLVLMWCYNAVCLVYPPEGCHGIKPYDVMYNYGVSRFLKLF